MHTPIRNFNYLSSLALRDSHCISNVFPVGTDSNNENERVVHRNFGHQYLLFRTANGTKNGNVVGPSYFGHVAFPLCELTNGFRSAIPALLLLLLTHTSRRRRRQSEQPARLTDKWLFRRAKRIDPKGV